MGALGALGACGGTPASPPTVSPVSPCDARTSVLAAEMCPEDRLEMGLRSDGTLSVQLLGCHVRRVPACKGPGKYVYSASNAKDETVRAPELDPVVATQAARSGDVTLRMVTVGTFATQGSAGRPDAAASAACARATHVVTGFTAGAFELSSSQSAEGLGGATASRKEVDERRRLRGLLGRARFGCRAARELRRRRSSDGRADSAVMRS